MIRVSHGFLFILILMTLNTMRHQLLQGFASHSGVQPHARVNSQRFQLEINGGSGISGLPALEAEVASWQGELD